MKKFVKIAKAVSDTTRLRIVKMLQQKSMCVCELQGILGIAQSAVSKHLKILEEAGMIESRKDGMWVEYFIRADPESHYAESILAYIKTILNDDGQIVSDIKKAQKADRRNICRQK